ncbi:alpha/beta hydrolase [Acaryochloris sp. IP29b_bin.137]|uniref:alpha/beta hydrolase n=1 Tax=Acaryochloris sp. IP29b_bin.137 TaxID=2969217 RepID=UPI00262FD010|nr:alpha/beta hydrolase [Acaryochloris sp. IP29b_bin.137]
MSYYRRLLCAFSSALMLVGLSCATSSSRAAEKITVSYGPFGRSIAVSDLRQLLETGSAPPDLASVLSVVGQQERESLLGGLKFKVPLNVVVLDKILRSPQGDQLLSKIAGATSLPGGAEKLALRSALIGAASSKDGLGILSFLEAYPTQTLKIDLAAVQKLMKSGSLLGGFMGGQFPGGDAPTAPPASDAPTDSDNPVPPAADTPAESGSQDPPAVDSDAGTAEEAAPETSPNKTPQ